MLDVARLIEFDIEQSQWMKRHAKLSLNMTKSSETSPI